MPEKGNIRRPKKLGKYIHIYRVRACVAFAGMNLVFALTFLGLLHTRTTDTPQDRADRQAMEYIRLFQEQVDNKHNRPQMHAKWDPRSAIKRSTGSSWNAADSEKRYARASRFMSQALIAFLSLTVLKRAFSWFARKTVDDSKPDAGHTETKTSSSMWSVRQISHHATQSGSSKGASEGASKGASEGASEELSYDENSSTNALIEQAAADIIRDSALSQDDTPGNFSSFEPETRLLENEARATMYPLLRNIPDLSPGLEQPAGPEPEKADASFDELYWLLNGCREPKKAVAKRLEPKLPVSRQPIGGTLENFVTNTGTAIVHTNVSSSSQRTLCADSSRTCRQVCDTPATENVSENASDEDASHNANEDVSASLEHIYREHKISEELYFSMKNHFLAPVCSTRRVEFLWGLRKLVAPALDDALTGLSYDEQSDVLLTTAELVRERCCAHFKAHIRSLELLASLPVQAKTRQQIMQVRRDFEDFELRWSTEVGSRIGMQEFEIRAEASRVCDLLEEGTSDLEECDRAAADIEFVLDELVRVNREEVSAAGCVLHKYKACFDLVSDEIRWNPNFVIEFYRAGLIEQVLPKANISLPAPKLQI